MTPQDLLWDYLRRGISELETEGFNPAPSFVHPGGFAYGDLGLTKGAFETVYRLYPQLRRYTWQDVITYPEAYELASRAYADWLLKNYLKNIPLDQLLNEFQAIWYLGPGDYRRYKRGKKPKVGSIETLLDRTKRLQGFGFVPSEELRNRLKEIGRYILF